MAVYEYIEYVGSEDNFLKFIDLLNDKLDKEDRKVKLWCNLEFLPKFRSCRRIIPIYYQKYSNQLASIKAAVRKRELLAVFREIYNRITHRSYMRYLKNKDNNIVPCCLINYQDELKVVENVKEEDFYGRMNTIVLRRSSAISGMFSHLMVMLPYFKWAQTNNLSIYFDMSIGDSIYREKKGENAWEYYYQQVGSKPTLDNGTIVSEAFKISDNYKIPEYRDIKSYIGFNNVYNKYVLLNKYMDSLVDKNWKRIMGFCEGGGKILGVKFRGTDYSPDTLFYQHPYQATCNEMIKRTKDFLHKYNYQYIYLCTEEQENLDIFKKHFGEKVLYYDCKLIENYKGGDTASNQIALVGKRKAGEDYIGSIMCLAKCDSILCSPNSGMHMAIVINGGEFEHIEIIDKGLRV